MLHIPLLVPLSPSFNFRRVDGRSCDVFLMLRCTSCGGIPADVPGGAGAPPPSCTPDHGGRSTVSRWRPQELRFPCAVVRRCGQGTVANR